MDEEIIVEENGGGISLTSFMLGLGAGLALGVIGTVVYATYSEEQFGRVVRKTRQIGDQTQQTAGMIRDKVGNVAETAKKTIAKVARQTKEGVDGVADMTEDLATR